MVVKAGRDLTQYIFKSLVPYLEEEEERPQLLIIMSRGMHSIMTGLESVSEFTLLVSKVNLDLPQSMFKGVAHFLFRCSVGLVKNTYVYLKS